MKKLVFFLFLFVFVAGEVVVAQNGWTNLFNGKDLSGWKQLNGKAKYEVINGEIVGTTVLNTPNSFLATEKTYSDFIFEVDLFVAENMNSGIQFRSESTPDYMNGRVHGYQCEVDPSERAWSAGIYDEARRGWLYPVELNPEAKTALRHGEWNHYRIECIGNSIRTWLNGVAVAHVIDDMTHEGFIALQVHAIGKDKTKEGHQIKWKNIRIKTKNLTPAPTEGIYVVNLIPNNLSPAEKEQGFKLLFDGNSMEAWQSAEGKEFPAKAWKVEDGTMTIMSKSGGQRDNADIITKEKFGAFEFKFEFNFTKGANSGVKYEVGNNGPHIGLEYQVIDDENHPDAIKGNLGNHSLASLYDLIPAEKEKRFVKGPGEWNRGRIVVYPDKTAQHWLNGKKVVEYKLGDAIFKALVAHSKYKDFKDFGMVERTPVLLQDHGDTVHYRSLKIREL